MSVNHTIKSNQRNETIHKTMSTITTIGMHKAVAHQQSSSCVKLERWPTNRANELKGQLKRPPIKPRGSLSSCSSSSPDLSEPELDYNDNVFYEHQAQLNIGELMVGSPMVRRDENNNNSDNQSEYQPRTDTANKSYASLNLHKRSTSLIVNPAYDPSIVSDTKYEPNTFDDRFCSSKRKQNRIRLGRERYLRNQQSVQVNAGSIVQEEGLVRAQLSQLSSTERLNEDDMERLRLVGVDLRQISEEFSRNRRWTI